MERKIYLRPAIKVLDTDTDRMMFEPGGGVSEANPKTPGVNSAPANEASENSFDLPTIRSVWDD